MEPLLRFKAYKSSGDRPQIGFSYGFDVSGMGFRQVRQVCPRFLQIMFEQQGRISFRLPSKFNGSSSVEESRPPGLFRRITCSASFTGPSLLVGLHWFRGSCPEELEMEQLSLHLPPGCRCCWTNLKSGAFHSKTSGRPSSGKRKGRYKSSLNGAGPIAALSELC